MWQKPGSMQTSGSPVHKVPAHPGADDDTDDEEEGEQQQETQEIINEITENKCEPIQNLIDEPTSEAEDNDE